MARRDQIDARGSREPKAQWRLRTLHFNRFSNDDATSIVSIIARFDKLLAKMSTANREDNEDHDQILTDLYGTAEIILSRNEARLAHWNLKYP